MRPWLLLVAVVALVLSATASAGAETKVDGGCTVPSSERGFCSHLVVGNGSDVYWELVSFEGRGTYRLCIDYPRRSDRCLRRQLEVLPRTQGLGKSRLDRRDPA